MKVIRLFRFLILALLLSNSLLAQINLELATKIDSLKQTDQRLRNQVTEFKNSGNDDSIKLERLYAEMSLIDSLNQIELKKIFLDYGYPGINLVGKQSAHNFWLLIQHADANPDFQLLVLNEMKKEVDKENADGRDYAYLIDRVLRNQGEAQIYGTQMKLNSDSTSFEPQLLFEPEKINERRLQIGLGPIEWYIETMNERYYGVLRENGNKN